MKQYTNHHSEWAKDISDCLPCIVLVAESESALFSIKKSHLLSLGYVSGRPMEVVKNRNVILFYQEFVCQQKNHE